MYLAVGSQEGGLAVAASGVSGGFGQVLRILV